MRIKFFPTTLSRQDRALLNIVLDVELDVQSWYMLTCSRLLREELIIGIQ
jgi:hypothetical protein